MCESKCSQYSNISEHIQCEINVKSLTSLLAHNCILAKLIFNLEHIPKVPNLLKGATSSLPYCTDYTTDLLPPSCIVCGKVIFQSCLSAHMGATM